MSFRLFTFFFIFFNFSITINAQIEKNSSIRKNKNIDKILKRYQQNILFEKNEGQWGNLNILYQSRNTQSSIRFLKDRISIGVLEAPKGKDKFARDLEIEARRKLKGREKIEYIRQQEEKKEEEKGFVYNMIFHNSNKNYEIKAIDEQIQKLNYLKGNDPSKHRASVNTYKELRYQNLYNNIDARFYGKGQGTMEYDFIIYPGGNPKNIYLEFEGLEELRVDDKGNLIMKTPLGNLEKSKPYTYQVINGKEIEIPTTYIIEDNYLYFEIGDYDKNEPLIIDPTVIKWSTLLGGSNRGYLKDAKINSLGEYVIYGYSQSSNFPTTPGAFQTNKFDTSNDYDYTISILSADGSTLISSTYVGGSQSEYFADDGDFILLDNDDNVFIVGRTRSSDFPTTSNSFIPNDPSPDNTTYTVLAAKLTPDLSTLIYSTYLGNEDYHNSLFSYGSILLNANNELVVGLDAKDIPTPSNAYQPITKNGTAYIIVLDDIGNMKHATYIGNSLWISQIMQDSNGNLIAAGIGKENEFQPTSNAIQPNHNGGYEAVVISLSPDLTTANFGTFFGGSGDEEELFAKIDNNDNICISIIIEDNPDFPVTPGAFDQTFNGKDDVGLLKLDPNGNLIFATYVGGTEHDDMYFLEINDNNDIIIAGETKSYADADPNNNIPLPPNNGIPSNGNWLGYIGCISSDGSNLLWSIGIGELIQPWDGDIHVENNHLLLSTYTGVTEEYITPDAYHRNTEDQMFAWIDALTGEVNHATYHHSFFERIIYNSSINAAVLIGNNDWDSPSLTTEGAYQESLPGHGIIGNVVVLELCRDFTPNTLKESAQTVCFNGSTALIEGTEVDIIGSLPNLVYDGIAQPYPSIQIQYQWQISTDGISWADIEGATDKDYVPDSPTVTSYYRRIVKPETCSANTISNVHTVTVNPAVAPNVDAGEPQGVCPGGSVTIGGSPTATGGSGAYSYEWAPNIGLESTTIANPTATPLDDIIYSVTVTDTANGCTKVEQTTVAYVAADAGPDVSFCDGTPAPTVGTHAPPNTTGFIYSWEILGGGTTGISDPTIDRPQMAPLVPTEYVVTVDGAAGCPDRDTVLVTPNPSPTVNAGPDQSVCIGDTISIGTTAPVGGITYTWYAAIPDMILDETISITEFSPYAEPAQEELNPLTVYVRALDSGTGCYALDEADITIDTFPLLDLLDIHVCSPVQIQAFEMPTVPGTTYRWFTLPPTAPATTMLSDTTIAFPIATVTEATTFYLEVVSPQGCSKIDQTTVYPTCGGPGGTCDIPDASNDKVTVCNDTDSIFIYITKDSDIYGDVYNYVWTPSAGILTTDTDVSGIWVLPDETTIYKCEIFLENDPSTKVCEDTVTVYRADTIVQSFARDTIICPGQITPIGQIPYPGHTYEWQPAEGLATGDEDEANPYVNPIVSTEYYLNVTIDANGCSKQDTSTVIVQSPFADAGLDGEFCEGAFVVLGAPPVGHHTYDWSPSIGLSDSTSSMPSLTLYTPTTFYLLAIDTLTNCAARDTVEFIDGIPPIADAGEDVTICNPAFGVAIGGIDSTAYGYSYSWLPIEGLSNPLIANPIAAPNTTTTYTLYVQKPNVYGCVGIDEITVTLDPVAGCPDPEAGPDVEICLGESTIIGTNAGTFDVQWSPTIGLDDPTIAIPTASPTETTKYYVSWTDTSTGASGLDSVTVTVHLPPTAIAGTDKDLCDGSSVNIGVENLAGYSYSWNPTTGLSNPTNGITSVTITSNQEYILTKTDLITGCFDTDTINITIISPPIADAGPDITICSDPYPTIGTATVAGLEYSWSPIAGLSDAYIAQPTVNVNQTTTYTLLVKDPTTGCIAEDQVTVTPDTEIDLGAISHHICEGDSVQLGTPALGGYTYVWAPAASLDNANIAEPVAFPLSTTTYTVTVTNTGNGCTRTANIEVEVTNPIADAGGNQIVCSGANIILGTPEIIGYSYSWYPTTNLSSNTEAQPLLTNITNSQQFILTTTHIASGCQARDTIFIDVTATPAPIADAGDDKYFCDGTFGVQIGTPAVGGLNYYWTPSDNLDNPNIAQPMASPSVETQYILEVNDPVTGCRSYDIVIVTPASQTVNAGTDQTMCQGGEVQLLTSNYNYSYYDVSWTNEETLSPYSSTWTNYGLNYRPYASPTDTTTYTLTVLNLNTGCIGTDQVTVNVRDEIAPIANAGEDLWLCRGDTIQIGSDSIPGMDYAWNTALYLSDRYISNPETWALSSRTYYVTVTDPVSGCTARDDIRINVSNPIADAGATQYICQGESVILGPSFLFSGYDPSWIDNGTFISAANIQNPEVAPTSTTTYSFTISDTRTGGMCYNSDTVTVYVESAPIAEAGPDRDIILGETTQLGINAFPNYSYSWTPSSTLNVDNVSNPFASPTDTTTYYLTVTNELTGCTSIDSVTINVNLYASLGDFVWLDDNQNGIQDVTEVGVAGITVSLYDTNDNLIASTITDAFGYYLFNNIRPDDYYVIFTPPANYTFSPLDNGDDDLDSDANSLGISNVVSVGSNEDIRSVDAGLIYQSSTLGSIGDFVWLDDNQNGIQDSNEAGVSAVLVSLYDNAGNIILSTYTNNNGYYLFEEIPAGDYQVGFSLPIGTIFTSQTSNTTNGSDANTSTGLTVIFSLADGENNLDLDAGLILQSTTKASLGNYVWYDNNNGIQESGEVGVRGVGVTLYNSSNVIVATTITDIHGFYVFNNLDAGDYYVHFDATTLPSGYSFVNGNTGGDDNIDSDVDNTNGANTTSTYTLAEGDRNMSVDVGIYNGTVGTASIGDFVWYDINQNGIQDAGEEGVAGITVILYDNGGNILTTTVTNLDGYYLFPNLDAGNYSIQFTNLPQNYIFTIANSTTDDIDSDASENGFTSTITLAIGENNIDIDAGIIAGASPSGTASLGDKVFYDLNNNGIQDTDELGVQGIIINLYYSNDLVNPIQTTTSNSLGEYLFTGLEENQYVVEFDLNSLHAGYQLSPQNIGGDDTIDSDANSVTGFSDIIDLMRGEEDLSIDAGIYNPSPLGSLGDFVWYDLNEDGIQDSGEPGVQGISVQLLNRDGISIKGTTTDATGKYMFYDLPDGVYSVEFSNIPSGFSFTSQTLNSATGSDADVITGKTNQVIISGANSILDLDAGIIGNIAMLGDYVWLDANEDGIQDANEDAIAGVTIILNDAVGNPLSSTVTDDKGYYLFTNLPPAEYSISLETLPNDVVPTQQNATTDDIDSDINETTLQSDNIILANGDINLTLDAGLIPNKIGSLGDFVWYDNINTDGIQDVGELGVPGMLVILYNSSNDVIGKSMTNERGYYLFDNLSSDDYYVEFNNLPTDCVFTYYKNAGSVEDNDSDADRMTYLTPSYTVNENHIRNVDAGIGKLSIQGYAWYDVDKNGIREVAETLLEGVVVTVHRVSDDVSLGSTITNSEGFYEFIELNPGDYYVKFDETSNTAGYAFVSATEMEANADADITDAMDSDIDITTKETPDFILNLGDTKRNIDAGFVTEPLPVEMLYFSGHVDGCTAQLNWGTASEEMNDYFVVEKSLDGNVFFEIGRVSGAGTTAETQHYSFEDEQLRHEYNYYRLKQVDFDGTFEYSETIMLQSNCANVGDKEFIVYPNPTLDDVHLEVKSDVEGLAEISIIDVTGKILNHFEFDLNEGTTVKTISLSDYTPGMYIIALKDNSGRQEIFYIAKVNE